MGSLHEKSGRIDEAFKAAGNSRDLLEGVVRDHPEDLDFHYGLAWTMGWIGEFYHRRTNRQAEAIPSIAGRSSFSSDLCVRTPK